MIRQLIKKITFDICEHNNFSDEKKYEIAYVMTSITFELIKMIAILIFFYLFGYLKESLLIVTVMMFTKPFIGGYHEDTQFKCLFSTIIISIIIIYLSEFNILNSMSIFIISSLNIFTIYHKAPIISKDMMITKESLIKRNKFIGTLNSTIFLFIALFLLKEGLYRSIITWTMLIQVCLMFNKD